MRHLILTSLAALLGVFVLTGCQESQSSQIQRARLVGQENLQLKKEIKTKDAELEKLKKEIEELKLAKDKSLQQSGEANIKVLKIVAESEAENEQLRKENEALKAELKKLKAQ